MLVEVKIDAGSLKLCASCPIASASPTSARVAGRRISNTDIKVVVPPGMPLIEPLPAVDFRPCRPICESRFSKKFFSKKILHGWSVCGGAPEGKRNGNYRHGARSRKTIELWRLIKSLLRLCPLLADMEQYIAYAERQESEDALELLSCEALVILHENPHHLCRRPGVPR